MDSQMMLSAALTGMVRAIIMDASLSMAERLTLCDIIIDIYRLHDVPQTEQMINKFKDLKHELELRKDLERITNLN